MDTMTFIRENGGNTVRACRESREGNIGLPYPCFVPSITGGFTNLYYWDSFFMAQGMLRQGQEALVKSTVDDMLCLIDRYGYMPNGNAEGLMGRSQPPFLRMMRRLLSCGLNRYGYEVAEQGTDLAFAWPSGCRDWIIPAGRRRRLPRASWRMQRAVGIFPRAVNSSNWTAPMSI